MKEITVALVGDDGTMLEVTKNQNQIVEINMIDCKNEIITFICNTGELSSFLRRIANLLEDRVEASKI